MDEFLDGQEEEHEENITNFNRDSTRDQFEKIKIIIWPAHTEDDEIISQKKSYNTRQDPGHVSLVFPDGTEVSWWPGSNAQVKIRKGINSSIAEDYVRERVAPKVYKLYSLNVAKMKRYFNKVLAKAEKGEFGWTLIDNRYVRDFKEDLYRKSDKPQGLRDGASCAGMVRDLLVKGGLDKLMTLGRGLIPRYFLASPENFIDLMESASRVERARYPQTREMHNNSGYQGTARVSQAGFFAQRAREVVNSISEQVAETVNDTMEEGYSLT